ncbi:MAG: hypothetical protein P4L03_03080 [Terracidiphilus sp.]|nr:hypothetical protein [Terracidiphilus sp.]
MPNLDSQTILYIILAAVAVALVGQTILLLAIFVVLRKTARSFKEDFDELRSDITPIIHNTRELFIRVAPRIEDTAADLAAMAHGLRAQTADIQSSATELLDKLRHQSARLDAMITSVFDAVDHATTFVTETVARPVRQLSSILASAKAVVESLRSYAPEPPAQPSAPPQPPIDPEDKGMFV